jgi:hypothetical protein
MEPSINNEIVEEIKPKRRGRPKTVTVDKKEYRKQYYQANKNTLLQQGKEYYNEHKNEIRECQKEYIEDLKINNPEKFKELREKQKEQGNLRVKRSLELLNLIKELIEQNLIVLPDSHKDTVINLVNQY